MSEYLFVYGTLQSNSDNEFAKYLKNNSTFISNGQIQGQLYQISWYPGLILSENSADAVHGQIMALSKNVNEILTKLDEYEGLDPSLGLKNEYIRKKVIVKCNHEDYNCWAYIYNMPTDQAKRILSGKFSNSY